METKLVHVAHIHRMVVLEFIYAHSTFKIEAKVSRNSNGVIQLRDSTLPSGLMTKYVAEESVHVMSLTAIHIDLIHNPESDPLLCRKLFDLIRLSGLMTVKRIASKSSNRPVDDDQLYKSFISM